MTRPDSIPEPIRRFILTSVPSVPFLEAARKFHAEADVVHSPASIAAALYVPATKARQLLDELVAAGIVSAAEGGYRYAPREPGLAKSLDQLFVCYQTDLIGVTNLVHDATRRSAERFANAFRLRKDANDG